MADVGIYTKNAVIQVLAGTNAGSTEKLEAATDVYVLHVEAQLDVRTGEDWSSLWTANKLDETLRNILALTGAARCAMIVIQANVNGYSANERQTQMNFCNSIYDEGVQALMVDDGAGLVKGEAN